MKPDLKRYELYDPISNIEPTWYKAFARRAGGLVLELACGTGRLLTAIAEEGYKVVGIDLSRTMVHLARERISHLPIQVRKRIQLHNGDMSSFSFEKRFSLVIVADDSLRELSSKAQMLACLHVFIVTYVLVGSSS